MNAPNSFSSAANARLEALIRRLEQDGDRLRRRGLLEALRSVDATTAVRLRRSILRIAAFLDDSVSDSTLGSLFDSNSSSPLGMAGRNVATAYGVARTYFSTTGTTALNVPAVMTVAGEHNLVIVARDCHISVIAGLQLSGAIPRYLSPPFDEELGIILPPTRAEVSAILDRHPDARALILTAPTYHGVGGDIGGIIDECKMRKVTVMVDEAHGAHLHFVQNGRFPLAAEDFGADIVTQSTHKLLAALNQGSLLHLNNALLAKIYEEFQATGFQSTSFSFLILVSIEHAIEQMLQGGAHRWFRAAEMADAFRDELRGLPGIRVIDESIIDGNRVRSIDPSRVTINVRETGRTGFGLAERLHEQGDIVEMATPEVILFLVGPATTVRQIRRTALALRGELRQPREINGLARFLPPPAGLQAIQPRRALFWPKRLRVPANDAIGHISGETIACYPPGQAIIVAGEMVTPEAIRYLQLVARAGGHLKRVHDDNLATIEILFDIQPD